MKKVTGYIDVRALGHYDWEFYVEDNATDEEIKELTDRARDYYINYVGRACDYYFNYKVEECEAYTEFCYRNKNNQG